ncbi:MerR family transcriptional regulator [Streptomyces sp. NPDC054796]
MDGTTLYAIGELSRRTGLSVRTIRFWSDAGVVVPAGRNPAGYRLYDHAALLRLELVRTLRELGIGLATVRRVLDRELSMADVAEAHAAALDTQIRTLRLRRSVLRVVAGSGSDPEETQLMHRLTQLSADERRRLIDDFVADTFGPETAPGTENPPGTDGDAEGAEGGRAAEAMVRAAAPDLPEDPSTEQVAAWVELAELVGDPDFRARIRRAAVEQATGRAPDIDTAAGAALMEYARERIAGARAAGVDPLDDEAAPVVDDLVPRFADALGRTPDAEFREWLAQRFARAHDPRVERYWRLVWTVNGWQEVPHLLPVHPWLAEALAGNHATRR